MADGDKTAGATSSELAAALSPHGKVYLASSPSDGPPLGPAASRRIERAFEKGHGHGLLHLGAVETATELPPTLAFWRNVSRLFMTRLCAAPDLASNYRTVDLPPPDDELAPLADAAPPMTGGEYLTGEVLWSLWSDVSAAFRVEVAEAAGGLGEWLARCDRAWSLVGRVCLHLAENKRDPQAPFAFLATYATRVSDRARVQHVPLGRALQEYAGEQNRAALLNLLLPVQKAAAQSKLLRELVDSGEVFHPLAWTPRDAYRFLMDIPLFEASGLVVRVPDWWNPKRPPRPQVSVTVGKNAASSLGVDGLLDFSVALTLDGEPLSREEWERIAAATDGLALIKGKWVELDRQKLDAVLQHWKSVQRHAGRDGVSFVEALRLLAGAAITPGEEPGGPEAPAEWSKVIAGDWLARTLAGLRSPDGLGPADPGAELRTTLRPYQQVGVRWLWLLDALGLGGCLADDMGLGKTVQVIALLLLLRRRSPAGTSLLVLPASLLANWKSELDRFAPALRVLIAHPSAMPAKELAALPPARVAKVDVVLTSYGSLLRLPWLQEREWSVVVLDEAQAIKNPGAKQTRAAKKLRARTRLALTGTPLENRLSDLWSLFDFACPGLLGSAQAFGRFVKRLDARERDAYAPLRNLVRPYILRRLKTDKSVIADLPDKTELRAFCGLTRVQAALYQQAVDELAKRLDKVAGIERRGTVLAFLMRLKQICNHPSQWLGDNAYAPGDSGKFARLRELGEEIASRQEKALVFTQFREMTSPLLEFLQQVFGRPGLVLHGETPVGKRQGLVDAFQRDDGPPFFVLSLKAGGKGLNLTAASHVLHFDRWWNPAVEDQATDRAFRIGQQKNVLVHKFVCRGTVEEKIDSLIEGKRGLATEVLAGGGEPLLTELPDDELLRLVSLDIRSALAEG
ncbi:MAG: DEAD/DEAH box helicase [Deltaproteobacteria bacterium]|nr:DEAD/DEAH box helicase [Deltaproteobacteria bacterium]